MSFRARRVRGVPAVEAPQAERRGGLSAVCHNAGSMTDLVDFILHSDQRLLEVVRVYGSWVYGLLFAIVFAETGLVVTPFLPGDSLLFATGALCASGSLSTPAALALLTTAAFTGNAVNYTIGRIVGPRVFSAADQSELSHRLLN